MPPETPKNSAKTPAGLTPSLTFGHMAALPSAFRFVLPRNMNLLSSLSPHRLFSRLCRHPADGANGATKSDSPASVAQHRPDAASPTRQNSRVPESFHDAMLPPFVEGHQSLHESSADLVGTADSVDIWSFASDPHAVPMNLTAITEDADDNDVFFSPHEMFLKKSPLDSEISLARSLQTPGSAWGPEGEPKAGRKRALSDAEDSPCSKVAARASSLALPSRAGLGPSRPNLWDLKKVWTAALDDELMRCFRKYNLLKEAQGSNEAMFRGSSQNKVLSRMLETKTSLHRTPKQVLGRLLKLLKSAAPRIIVEPAAESTPLKQKPQSLPVHAPPERSLAPLGPVADIKTFNMSFQYRDPSKKCHIFAHCPENHRISHQESSIDTARDRLPQTNSRFLADFNAIAQVLQKEGVPVHLVSCDLRLRPNFGEHTSPLSPTTSPQQFAAENGSFLSYLTVMLRENIFATSLVTLKCVTTVYKNATDALFESEESINGYREENKALRLEIPFLGQFWAGFLSFIVGGSSDCKPLDSLIVSQKIYDRQGLDEKVYGFFVYRFSVTGSGNAHVEALHLPPPSTAPDEVDDLETILASSPGRSSPYKSSPSKRDLRIQTSFDSAIAQGPSTAPLFDSGVLHQNNVNYEFAKMTDVQRPVMPISKSTTSFNFEQRPVSGTIPHPPIPYNLGNRHHSAGQMGSFTQHRAVSASHDYFCPQPMSGTPSSHFNINRAPLGIASAHIAPINPTVQKFQSLHPLQHMFFSDQTGMVSHATESPIASVPWQIPANSLIPQEINSAPASQLQFFPTGGQSEKENMKKARLLGQPLKFHTMLLYDPSRGVASESKKENRQNSYHTFSAKRQVAFKTDNT